MKEHAHVTCTRLPVPGHQSLLPLAHVRVSSIALEQGLFIRSCDCASMTKGMALAQMPKALLSDEGVRVITTLQDRLRHTQWKLRDAEDAAEKALEYAEESGAQVGAVIDRQQQVERALKRLEEERGQDVKHEELLNTHLASIQEEVLELKSNIERTVPREETDALQGELQRLRSQLAKAEQEGQDLRAQLAEAEESRRKRARRPLAESEGSRQCRGQQRALVLKEARQRSARVVSEQKERDAKMQAERAAKLAKDKESLEVEWLQLCKDNTDLDKRLEEMRSRNRKIEAMHRRCHDAVKEREAVLLEELRRHMRQIHVLTSLLDGSAAVNSIREQRHDPVAPDSSGSPSLTTASEVGAREAFADIADSVGSASVGSNWGVRDAVAPVAVADEGAGGHVSASICLWNTATPPTRGAKDHCESSEFLHGRANLMTPGDSANEHLSVFSSSPQETTDQCLGRLDDAISRTHGLLSEVKDWCRELGNSPGASDE